MDSARGNSGLSINPINYADIRAWATLLHVEIHPWEVKAIVKIDAEYVKVRANKAKEQ